MKRLVKKAIVPLLCVTLFLCLMSFTVTANSATATAPVEYDNISIGAGAAFYSPLINPTDSSNYIALSDMNDVYYSLDAGQSWGRTETMTNFYNACFSDRGTLFVGGTGVYASDDKGQTLNIIYPRADTIKARSSRNGRNNEVILADGYDNGYVTCMDTYGNRVYFVTVNWDTNRTLQLLGCDPDGSNLVCYYTYETNMATSPQDANHHLLALEDGFYFSTGKTIYFIDYNTRTMTPIFFAGGAIVDLTKIGEYFFILDDEDWRTHILYTKDFVSYENLNRFIGLPNYFERYGSTHYFDWHFKEVSGNSMNSIFISFTSEVECSNELMSNLGGVLKFNGKSFEWVFDTIFQNRSKYNIKGWSFGSYDPINGICIDPNNDEHCLMANIDTVYDIYYGSSKKDVQSLHSRVKQVGDITCYSSTGLDAQTSTFVRVDPFDSQHLLIGTADIGLQISYDGGESFTRMRVDSNYAAVYNTCYDVYFDAHTPGLVYGLWSSYHGAPYIPSLSNANALGYFAVSHDGGVTWDFTYSTGLPTNSIPDKMSVVPNGDNLMIAVSTYNNGFYISYDSGRTFSSVSSQMDAYNGLIWGQDVVLTEDYMYCLTAWHSFGGSTPSVLYKIDLDTGVTTRINLGKVINARSLTYDKKHGLYLNAIHNTTWGWREDIQEKFDVNTDGGVYLVNASDTLTRIFDTEFGVSSSGFTSDGTMYVVADKGEIYVKSPSDNAFRLYADGLFTRMQNISFSPDGSTLYATTYGGGTYRMPTLDTDVIPGNTMYLVTFQNYDGTVISRQLVSAGSAATVPANPTRPADGNYCYTFTGWDANTNYVVSNMTVTAKYSAKAHTSVTRNQKAATCSATGYTGDQYCTHCGTLLAKGNTTPKLSHTTSIAYSGNNGTHTYYCKVCWVNLYVESCTNNGKGQCSACGYKMSTTQKFTRATAFSNGSTYLIGSYGYVFGYGLKPSIVTLSYSGGAFVSNQGIPRDMLWTYDSGYLYTVYNGQTYYLTLSSSRPSYTISVTTSKSAAVYWTYSNGGLAVTVYESGKFTYKYVNISSQGITLSSSAPYVTIYKLQP